MNIKNVIFNNIPKKKQGLKLGSMITQSNIGATETVQEYLESDKFYKLVSALDIDWAGIQIGENIEINDTADLINWISSLPVSGGSGKSAYELYVEEETNKGADPLSLSDWLESLQGEPGTSGSNGKSAYELYLESVPQGETPLTQSQWLDSLKGNDGSQGLNGKSAYDIAVEQGFIGNEEEWLNSLKGTSFKILGIYPQISDLTEQHPTGSEGDAYAVGTSESNVIYIWGENGWTNVGSLQGIQGSPGINGSDGVDGKDGKDGQDGITPQIRINNSTLEWEVSYNNGETWSSTGVVAKGDPGVPGNSGSEGRGITKIEKTNTVGLVDTYTITFSDDTTFMFTVTNGTNGGETNIVFNTPYDAESNKAATMADVSSYNLTIGTEEDNEEENYLILTPNNGEPSTVIIESSGNTQDAETVNGHIIESDVPANAVFTDTTYQFEQSGNDLKVGTNGGTKSVIFSGSSQQTDVYKLMNTRINAIPIKSYVETGYDIWIGPKEALIENLSENDETIFKLTLVDSNTSKTYNSLTEIIKKLITGEDYRVIYKTIHINIEYICNQILSKIIKISGIINYENGEFSIPDDNITIDDYHEYLVYYIVENQQFNVKQIYPQAQYNYSSSNQTLDITQ